MNVSASLPYLLFLLCLLARDRPSTPLGPPRPDGRFARVARFQPYGLRQAPSAGSRRTAEPGAGSGRTP